MAGTGQERSAIYAGTTAATNLKQPYEASRKPPPERPLHSECCLTGYFSTSA
jgi:hypothetical protein